MAVFPTLWVLLDTAIKGLLLQASWGLLPEFILGGTMYIHVWNRHLIPIQTPIPITTIPTPIPIPITTIPTPIPTPPKRTTNDSDSDSDSGIGVGIVVWFQLRSRNHPRSASLLLLWFHESSCFHTLPSLVVAALSKSWFPLYMLALERRGSVVVSTPAYHAADRGSNPARVFRMRH